MHCTRVTMLKLSFNGRQCQKLSLSISSVFRVSIVGAFRRSYVYFDYDFAKNRSTISARLGGFESFENMVS